MGLFRRKESFDEEKYNSYEAGAEKKPVKNFFSGPKGAYNSYKEKQTARAGAAKEFRRDYGVSQKSVEKDYGMLQKGAKAGLSGGALFGRMTKRRK